MPLPTYVLPGQSYIPQTTPASVSNPVGVDLYGQLANNLSGALKGELPEDVKQLLHQKAAQNAVASGTSGSQFADYQGLRTLGLTSLDRMQGAENSLVGPLLGYHPTQVIQPRPYQGNPAAGYQGGGGGFENTTPHYNVAPIRGGGGTPTLPDYTGGQRAAPTRATDPNAMYQQIIDKYSGIGNSGSAPMGQYGGPPLDMTNLDGGFGGGGYGINDQDLAQTTPGYGATGDLAYAQEQQNLVDSGLDPADFGY